MRYLIVVAILTALAGGAARAEPEADLNGGRRLAFEFPRDVVAALPRIAVVVHCDHLRSANNIARGVATGRLAMFAAYGERALSSECMWGGSLLPSAGPVRFFTGVVGGSIIRTEIHAVVLENGALAWGVTAPVE